VALSKREKIIGFTTAGVIALLATDRFVIAPLLERRSELAVQLEIARGDDFNAAQLLAGDAKARRRWKDMRESGLKMSVTEAQSQAVRALNEWAREAGLAVSTLQPDAVPVSTKQTDFTAVPMRLIGTGSMRSISKFLWSLQTSKVPMRVVACDLGSRGGKDGVDDLALTLTVSTLCYNPPAPKPGGATGATAAAAPGAQGVTR
jgi:hypothetical protein